jgi:IMP cyclohydrolase
MSAATLQTYLKGNSYPGRGILLGRSADGAAAVLVYFIMGRSENSRNRVFVPEGERISTQAFDPAKLKDPTLIIYSPVRVFRGHTIVTNGDQTDTIYETLAVGRHLCRGLRKRTFERTRRTIRPASPAC